jgi:hypothetical protein
LPTPAYPYPSLGLPPAAARLSRLLRRQPRHTQGTRNSFPVTMRAALFSTLLAAALSQRPNLCPSQPAGDAWAQMRCAADATCSPNKFSQAKGWGCCPWANATSCPSGYQCCPSGSTCNLISGTGYSAVYSCDGGAAPQGTTSLCPCKPGAYLPPSTTLKNVLVIGDSLSIGVRGRVGGCGRWATSPHLHAHALAHTRTRKPHAVHAAACRQPL